MNLQLVIFLLPFWQNSFYDFVVVLVIKSKVHKSINFAVPVCETKPNYTIFLNILFTVYVSYVTVYLIHRQNLKAQLKTFEMANLIFHEVLNLKNVPRLFLREYYEKLENIFRMKTVLAKTGRTMFC